MPKKNLERSLLALLLLSFTLLSSVGCGSSREDFVATNTGSVATTGDLVFQFTKAQAVEVPAATTALSFSFFNSADVEVFSAERPFAASVLVEDVPVTAVRVVITAYGPGGVPLATIASPVTVLPGGTANVNLTSATVTPVTLTGLTVLPNPVNLSLNGGSVSQQLALSGTFSNGDIVPFNATTGGTASFAGFDSNIATVSPAGLVTAVNGGSTSVDIEFTINGSTASLLDLPIQVVGPAGLLIVEPETLTFAPGGLIGALEDILTLGGDQIDNVAFFRAFFIPPGQTQPVEVTSRVGVTFNNFFPSTVGPESFTHLNLAGEGIAITSNPLSPTPPFGATATMTVTFISNGQVFTENVNITLDNPTLVAVDVASAPGGNLTLPADNVNDFPVIAYARYSNGFRFPIDDLAGGAPILPGYLDTFVLSIQTAATGLSLDLDGIDVSGGGGAGQTAVLAITANGQATPITTFNVNLIDAEVSEVALSVSTTDINPSGGYSVIATYDDAAGTTQDITGVWFEIENDTIDGGFVGFGSILDLGPSGRVLGLDRGRTEALLSDGTAAEVTLELNDLGLPGSDTLDSNNVVELNVLSTVPLAGFSGLVLPLP